MKGSGWTQTRLNAAAAKLRTHGLLSGEVCVHAFYAAPLSYAEDGGSNRLESERPPGAATPDGLGLPLSRSEIPVSKVTPHP
jgi:hypothetical protein